MDFFLHIPKSAGTAVRTLIAKNSKTITPDQLLVVYDNETSIDSIDRDKYKIVFGHFGMNFIRKFKQPEDRIFTFLRDPHDRLISFYNYWISGQANSVGSELSKNMSIDEFLASDIDNIKEQVNNIQTWMYAADYRIRERKRLENLLNYEILAIAKNNLEKFDFIGFQDTFNDSMIQLAPLVGIDPSSLKLKKINETKLKTLDKIDISKTKKYISLDMHIYEIAKKISKIK